MIHNTEHIDIRGVYSMPNFLKYSCNLTGGNSGSANKVHEPSVGRKVQTVRNKIKFLFLNIMNVLPALSISREPKTHFFAKAYENMSPHWTEEDVKSVLKSLKTGKAEGLYDMPNELTPEVAGTALILLFQSLWIKLRMNRNFLSKWMFVMLQISDIKVKWVSPPWQNWQKCLGIVGILKDFSSSSYKLLLSNIAHQMNEKLMNDKYISSFICRKISLQFEFDYFFQRWKHYENYFKEKSYIANMFTTGVLPIRINLSFWLYLLSAPTDEV